MNHGESHAWKFAASCNAEEMFRLISGVLQDEALSPFPISELFTAEFPGAESQLLLPQGKCYSWRGTAELEAAMAPLLPLLRAGHAHDVFGVKTMKAERVLCWQFFVERSVLPSLSCGLDAGAAPLTPSAVAWADQILLEQLARGCWNILYQATAGEWIGDPVWLYLKHKCDRVLSIRQRLIEERSVASTRELCPAMGLYSLLTNCLEWHGQRVPVARVHRRRVKRFLAEVDQTLIQSVPAASLNEALSPFGVEPDEWLGQT